MGSRSASGTGRLVGARLAVLWLLVPLLLAGSWTEDRGEQAERADSLDLGSDVGARVGSPHGRPLQGAVLEQQTALIASSMRCPVCQGLSINDSPAESARNMKRQVRAMTAAGYDRRQIHDYFVAAYGEFILMSPRAHGLNLLVWLLPAALLVAGLGAAARVLRRGRQSEIPAAAPDAPDPALDPWLGKVREELERDDA